MKRCSKILLAVLGLALFATACNGHGSTAKNQTMPAFNFHLAQNHGGTDGVGGGEDGTVWNRMRITPLYSGDMDYKVSVGSCLQYAVQRDSDAEVISLSTVCYPATTYQDSESYQMIERTIWTPPGHSVHAYESWYNFKFYALNNPNVIVWEGTCQYHDADNSNPTQCPGRDAEGN